VEDIVSSAVSSSCKDASNIAGIPPVAVLGLGGMWDRSEVGVRNLHSDSLHARQLRSMVTDRVVFCVSNSTGFDPGSLSTIQCDVRPMKSWTKNHRFGAGSIPGRGVNSFLLDYF
jgi:hypothetical protein